ncbi:Uncharacterized protein SCF082_LOCUS40543 [Durusdinium trenchii]|uniref:Uncharacterized protein n=1 Tax=Durusdinium trenchii TaxID=1381693 RepID=A0ABP0QD77_9DINO
MRTASFSPKFPPPYYCYCAPAKHVAAIAAAFAKTSSDGALSAIARCPQNDAERAMQKALCKFDLTLDAPVTYVNVGEQCLVPCLKPTDYVRTLNERAGALSEFWARLSKAEPQLEVCQDLADGSEQPDGSIPFEDFSDNPRWLRTTGQGNPLPWERYPPFLQFLPHSPEDPPSFFKLDVLHLYHLGVGRDFGASSLVYLMTLYEAESIPKAIEKLNSDFKSFLLSSKKVVHFKQITKDLLGYISSKAYPVGHWNKAMDTPVVVQFAEWLVEKFGGESTPDLLIRSGCKAIGVCMRTMLSSALWLDRSEAKIVGDAALHFAQCYGKLESGAESSTRAPALAKKRRGSRDLWSASPGGFGATPLETQPPRWVSKKFAWSKWTK